MQALNTAISSMYSYYVGEMEDKEGFTSDLDLLIAEADGVTSLTDLILDNLNELRELDGEDED